MILCNLVKLHYYVEKYMLSEDYSKIKLWEIFFPQENCPGNIRIFLNFFLNYRIILILILFFIENNI